jgi:hypothetical protein
VIPSGLATIRSCFDGTWCWISPPAAPTSPPWLGFHDGLDAPTPAKAKNIRCKVLVRHGSDDPHLIGM